MPQTIAKTAKGPIEYRLEGRGPTVMVLNGGRCSRLAPLARRERLNPTVFSIHGSHAIAYTREPTVKNKK